MADIQSNNDLTYDSYLEPEIDPFIQQILATTAITNLNGLSGPTITLAGGVSGFSYVPSGSTITLVGPLTTKGDLYTYSTVGTRFGVGTDGQVLTSDSASTAGLKWVTPGGGIGTVTSVSGTVNQIDVATGTTTPVISLDPVIITPGTLQTTSLGIGVAPAGGLFYAKAAAATTARIVTEAPSGKNVECLAIITGTQAWEWGVDGADSNKFKIGSADDSFASARFSITTAGVVNAPTLTVTTINGLTVTANGTNTLNIAAGKTLTVSNNATVSGTNTGDQTITLTGDVTGSGTGSFATTLASVITAGGPTGDATHTPQITYDAKGRLTAVASVTITPAVGSITGLGTGVATALGVNVGTDGAFVVKGGALGTPSSGVGTNLTGTASGLTAGAVTNATFTTALTVNGGTLTLTANAANTSVLTIGAGAVTVSGSNTGDQTITLTGAVTGSGTGSFATTLATPGTLTVSSTNSNATAHTHAITSSSAPGAAASILATDSSGILGSTGTRIVKIWATDLTVTNTISGSVSGNAATVTTNANLTGPITSVGNATSIASQTGTGTKFVVDTSPTLITPTLGVATATRLGIGAAADSAFKLLVVGNDVGNTGVLLNNTSSTSSRTFQILAGLTGVGQEGLSIYDSAAAATRLWLTNAGNLKIGGSAVRGTTEGVGHIDLFNGTNPVGTLSNGASFYCSAGEMYVIDAAGNPTLLSPHDQEGWWIFKSRSGQTGKTFIVHMEKLIRLLNKEYGGGFIEEIG